jgi:site-specific recombinase XerD
LELNNITEDDAVIIRDFLTHIGVVNNLSESRKSTITSLVCILNKAEPHVSIRELTKDTIYRKITNVKQNGYTQNSQRSILSVGKTFWKYLIKSKIIDCNIEDIDCIKLPHVDFETTSPDEIFTIQEILEMIKCANNTRDRAFIATLYESACRISEIATLRWKDIFTDEYGAKVYVFDHKTQVRKFCRLIIAAPYLNEWRNQYESFAPASGDNLVFVTLYKKTPIKYRTYDMIFKKLAKKAGITRPVHLHLMRKTRITHMVRENYNETVIKLVAWGNTNTRMMPTYTRLSEENVDNELLNHGGILDREDVVESIKSQKCMRCGYIIAPDQKYCPHCGMSTDPNLINREMSINPDLLSKILQIIQNQQNIDNKQNAGGRK